jgi:type IV pilus assembly protein PilW
MYSQRNKQSTKRIKGISLVELLVSMVIAALVFTASYSLYFSIKVKYGEYKDKMDAEVKELTAKRILYNFIKNSGFACRLGHLDQVYFDKTGDSLDNYFISSNSISVGTLPLPDSEHFPSSLESGCTADCFQGGSDYIMVKKDESNTELVATNSGSVNLNVKDASSFAANDYLVLCNNAHFNLVKATSVNDTSNAISIANAPEGSAYYTGDYIGKYSLEMLYTRDTGDEDEDGNAIYSLYVYIKGGAANGMSYELIRGISDLQIDYGTVLDDVITCTL